LQLGKFIEFGFVQVEQIVGLVVVRQLFVGHCAPFRFATFGKFANAPVVDLRVVCHCKC
jgi:hypothetical protein